VIQWISVKDRLPEAEDHVLATDGETVEKAFWYLNVWDKKVWTYYDWMDWKGVTHWMSLPEPPIEEA
jgi:hypothetical protein